MKKAQITLKLFLDALHIDPKISTLYDRKKVQKAVYIGQEAGVDLGYSYGWYLLGPYSPELTKDYFALSSDLITEAEECDKYTLGPKALKTLNNIKDLLQVPSDINLPQEDWLELVASIIYQMKETRNVGQTKLILASKKAPLMPFFDAGIKHLEQYRLISA